VNTESDRARYLAIEIQAVPQWERAKGEMRAMIALLGSVPSEYDGHEPIRPRNYERIEKLFDAFVAEIEGNEWHLPDMP